MASNKQKTFINRRDDVINYHRRPVADISPRPVAKTFASSSEPKAKITTVQDISKSSPKIPSVKPKSAQHLNGASPRRSMDIAMPHHTPQKPKITPPTNKTTPTLSGLQLSKSANPAANIVRKRKILEPTKAVQPNSTNLALNGTKAKGLINRHSKIIIPISTVQPKQLAKPIDNYSRLKFTTSTVKPRRANHKFSKDKFSNVPTLPVPKSSNINSLLKNASRLIKRPKVMYASVAILTSLVVVGLGIYVYGVVSNNKSGEGSLASEKTTAVSGEYSDGGLGGNSGYSEDQPTAQAVSRYTVSADTPKLIQISTLGILSRIIRAGSDNKTGEMGVPNNIFDTAWYEASAKPGENGAVLLNGHENGPTKDGIFANLQNIKIGTTIILTTGNGKQFNYKVASTKVIDTNKLDMAELLKSYEPNRQGLNIVAQSNDANDSKKTNKRLVVYALREN